MKDKIVATSILLTVLFGGIGASATGTGVKDVKGITPGVNAAPSVSNPVPVNGAENVSANTTLKLDVDDLDGDTLQVDFYNADTNEVIHREKDIAPPETVTVPATEINIGNRFNTSYKWYAVVSDGEKETKTDNYTFSTKIGPKTAAVEDFEDENTLDDIWEVKGGWSLSTRKAHSGQVSALVSNGYGSTDRRIKKNYTAYRPEEVTASFYFPAIDKCERHKIRWKAPNGENVFRIKLSYGVDVGCGLGTHLKANGVQIKNSPPQDQWTTVTFTNIDYQDYETDVKLNGEIVKEDIGFAGGTLEQEINETEIVFRNTKARAYWDDVTIGQKRLEKPEGLLSIFSSMSIF